MIPASPRRLGLIAETDGGEIRGQARISRSEHRIRSIRVSPSDAAASESALEAIAAADQIVVGPGSLFTSVVAALVVPGITAAVNASHAQLIYVANLITQNGETLGMDGGDHLEALLATTGIRPPACVVAHDGLIEPEEPLRAVEVDPDVAATFGADVEFADLLDPAVEWPRHDAASLGRVLGTLFRAHDESGRASA